MLHKTPQARPITQVTNTFYAFTYILLLQSQVVWVLLETVALQSLPCQPLKCSLQRPAVHSTFSMSVSSVLNTAYQFFPC